MRWVNSSGVTGRLPVDTYGSHVDNPLQSRGTPGQTRCMSFATTFDVARQSALLVEWGRLRIAGCRPVAYKRWTMPRVDPPSWQHRARRELGGSFLLTNTFALRGHAVCSAWVRGSMVHYDGYVQCCVWHWCLQWRGFVHGTKSCLACTELCDLLRLVVRA